MVGGQDAGADDVDGLLDLPAVRTERVERVANRRSLVTSTRSMLPVKGMVISVWLVLRLFDERLMPLIFVPAKTGLVEKSTRLSSDSMGRR